MGARAGADSAGPLMRILVLTNLYPPHYLGGYELSCRDVVARWSDRGHEVSVLTTDARIPSVPDDPDEAARGVHRDLRFYWEDHELVTPSLRERMRLERANQAALEGHLAEVRPDVVSVWNMGAMSLGLLATVLARRIPMVLNICDEWPVYGPRLDPWSRAVDGRPRLAAIVGRLTGLPSAPRRLAPDVTACFVSDFVRQRMAQASRFNLEDLAGSTVVYSGIDEIDFPIAAATPRSSWGGRLLYIGRLDERKGLFTALEAMRRLPADHHLDVVGRGGAAVDARLHAELAESTLRDRVAVSAVPREDLAEIYRRADAFLFTSEWAEPFGLTPVEAMACGTPVIGTGTGGSGEFLVDGVNCVRYEPGDVMGLVSAVQRVAEDAGLRGRLVAGGAATATQLGIEGLAATLEAWHLAAADGYASGPPHHRELQIPRRLHDEEHRP